MQPAQRTPCLLLPLLATLAALIAAPPASAAPTCAEGPETVGNTIVGTPCDDTIRAPRNITTVFGEGGNDTLYGQRGNDSLFGGEGNDRLYGGIGDDHPRGGPGDDMLSGGFGADSLDGEGGSDFVRGDATIDAIEDTGGGGTDTLSYATGVTPGFTNQGSFFDYEGFPGDANGRGVYIDLVQGFANNGLAPSGGGVDLELDGESFERVVGTPFPDFIVGSPGAEAIYGGGGADVILGGGGADTIHGGAEGDNCSGAGASDDCEESGDEVAPRDPGAIAVGVMAPPAGGPLALYLTGSDEDDEVTVSYAASAVTFALGAGSDGDFDAAAIEGCGPPAAGQVVCPVGEVPDSVLLAGLDGDDVLSATGFPATTSLVLLGNEGGDGLVGTDAEDVLIDGAGGDLVNAGGGDDAVPNNGGPDDLHAGSGEDLFISNSVCEDDLLDGGPDRDNANWANFGSAVSIDMGAGTAGLLGGGGQPQCSSAPLLTDLLAIEDTEGTSLGDTMIGDAGPNQLLGRPGPDTYFGGTGNDSILANSGTPGDDPDPTIDCGDGFDTAQIDHPENGPDAAPIGCESIQERDPNSFRPPDTPPDPEPEEPSPEEPTPENPPPENPPPAGGDGTATSPTIVGPTAPDPGAKRDRRAPETRILHRPERRIFAGSARRKVVITFTSGEADAGFRCRLDRGRFLPCRSPRAYWVPIGSHVIRVYAIDAAGNRDRTPVQFAFEVRRR